MKSSKFTFLQQRIQRRRLDASNITYEHSEEEDEYSEEEEMSPQRKEFLDLLKRTKQEYRGDKK